MPPHHDLSPNRSLRAAALDALCVQDPSEKVASTHQLWSTWRDMGADDAHRWDADAQLTPSAHHTVPGRPAQPMLVPPAQVAQRTPHTPEGFAALMHAIAHIEFNAINLALDAIWRFGGMPLDYYRQWLQVAHEEATHFGLLRDLLADLGHRYGDFPAHDGLWEMCVKTQHDPTARMALVPRTLEARGLDATPLIQQRLRQVQAPALRERVARASAILDIILRDEIGHVAVGNRWYAWLCAQQGLSPVPHYRHLARLHAAPRLRGPFNLDARRSAGFSEIELAELGKP
ncbi:MAG: ferritin-like domain-containing protein [Hydrogenophaga sp.]|uniref:ferritin-like domain-containing protein n=1 Tax=Hydrogenophaga sp. TaxID=1904254 RepID=UPI001D73F2CF|nr:ferritin-like domain-containing protein [Hydrogenophaga sp.]MBX3611326.1 ferritin-like domain-containing protein [Hydrogenophaga sp.]